MVIIKYKNVIIDIMQEHYNEYIKCVNNKFFKTNGDV